MERVKKVLIVFFVLLIINIIASLVVSTFTGETDLLRFEEVDSDTSHVRGIFPSVFFQLLLIIPVFILYLIGPSIFNFFTKNFPFWYRIMKTYASFIYGTNAVNDLNNNPKLFYKKTILTIFLIMSFVSIIASLALIDTLNQSPIFALIFISIVLISIFFLRKVYNWIS